MYYERKYSKEMPIIQYLINYYFLCLGWGEEEEREITVCFHQGMA